MKLDFLPLAETSLVCGQLLGAPRFLVQFPSVALSTAQSCARRTRAGHSFFEGPENTSTF